MENPKKTIWKSRFFPDFWNLQNSDKFDDGTTGIHGNRIDGAVLMGSNKQNHFYGDCGCFPRVYRAVFPVVQSKIFVPSSLVAAVR